MSSRFTVAYDACVLCLAPLRDLLTHLAKAVQDGGRVTWHPAGAGSYLIGGDHAPMVGSHVTRMA